MKLSDVSTKAVSTVLTEAIVVGSVLVVLYKLVSYLLPKKFMSSNSEGRNIVILFLAGAVFHLMFEYSGVNMWYAKNYPI